MKEGEVFMLARHFRGNNQKVYKLILSFADQKTETIYLIYHNWAVY